MDTLGETVYYATLAFRNGRGWGSKSYNQLSPTMRELCEYIGQSVRDDVYRKSNDRPQCGYCGRFVPKSAVHKAYDHWSGATGAEWECPSCGEVTSTI